MPKQFEIPKGYEELLMSEPKLISELTKAERKKIGRKVLNATLKNAPEGIKIYGSGDLILPDGSLVARTGHGRGKNAQYDFTPPEGYEIIPEPIEVDTAADKEAYKQSVEDVRKVRNEEAKERYDAYKKRMAEEQNSTEPIEPDTTPLEPAQEPNDASVDTEPTMVDQALQVAQDNITAPIRTGIDAINSGRKVIDQGQPINAMQDAGRGVMAGLADTAGTVADLGGLVPNRVADAAHDSADWWKDQYEIVDSEAESVGDMVGSEAVAGVAGGILGKGIGTGYNALRGRGEDQAKRATVAAADAQKRAVAYGQTPLEAAIVRQKAYENMTQVQPRHSYAKAFVGDAQPVAGSSRIDTIPYTPPLSEKDLITKAIRERNHLEGKYADGKSMTGADLMDPTGKGNLQYPTPARLLDTAIHNAKRQLGNKAMLKRNDAELDQLFSQGNALDRALVKRQVRWDQLPNTGQDIGAAVGMIMGANGGSDNDIIPTPKPYRNRRDIQLEGGMPDYDSVLDMSDAEFNEYDRKYLGGAGVP